MGTKQEIIQIVNHLPDEALDKLLLYLKQITQASNDKDELAVNLKQILLEDKELLEKLAQ